MIYMESDMAAVKGVMRRYARERDVALAGKKEAQETLRVLRDKRNVAVSALDAMCKERDAALARVKELEGMPSATYDPHDPKTWGGLFPPPTKPAPAGTTIGIGFWREGQEENVRLRAALAAVEAKLPCGRKAALAAVTRAVAEAFAEVQDRSAMATPSAEWSELLLATLAAIGKVQEGEDG